MVDENFDGFEVRGTGKEKKGKCFLKRLNYVRYIEIYQMIYLTNPKPLNSGVCVSTMW